MHTVVRTIDRHTWDAFVKKQTHTLFVQSPAYADFYKTMGEQAWIYGVYEGDRLLGGSVVVGIHARRGNFLYLPYGPIADKSHYQTVLTCLTAHLKKVHASQYAFIRVSPFILENADNKVLFKKAGYRAAPMHILAETTWMLDISGTEEALLSGMKKNHRNLVRRCEKEGVRVEMHDHDDALHAFNTLHDETAKRHKFHRFSSSYITKEFAAFAKEKHVAVFHAYLPDGTLDSSAIIMFYGNMAAYRHGASLGRDKKLPTSYAIQWAVIREAKRRGMTMYNFWGVAPADARKSHPFKGITHFKKGFGGHQMDLLPCQDYILSPRYYINWLIESIRRIRRGF